MRIALLTDGITPFVMGGMQRHSYLLAKYLALEGVDIDLYHFFSDPATYSEEAFLEVFPEAARSRITSIHVPFEDTAKGPGHYVRSSYTHSKRMYEALMQRPLPDFIYSKGFTAWYTLEQREKGQQLPPVSVKFHGMNMFQKQADWKGELTKYFFRKPVRWIMNRSDYVFSYGGKITDIIQREVQEPSKVVVIPTGIEREWLRHEKSITENRPLRFLFVGRYDRVKGLPELYKSLERLSGGGERWEMHFVGPIPEERQLKGAPYIYYGAVRDAEKLRGIYDQCDVLLCVSVSEGMPNVILEAMARGLAVVATDVGACSLMIEDNGFLVDPERKGHLDKVLKQTNAQSREEIERMKARSRTMIEGFMWEAIAKRYIEFLNRAVTA